MDELALTSHLALGEDSTRQFKRELVHPDSMAAEIVAFLNSGGGHLFIGVNDDGTVCGLESSVAQRMGSDIANIAWNAVRPPVSVLTESVGTSNGVVLVVSIGDGPSKPYCDRSGVYWVKNGPDKRRIQSPEELARLFQLGEKLYAESQPVSASTLDDFDHAAFALFHALKYGEGAPAPSEPGYMQLLENLNLVSDGKVTVVGLLMFGRRVPALLPEMKIDAVRFDGIDRSAERYLDQRYIEGTLSEQYHAVMGFLRAWNVRRQSGDSFNTPSVPAVPEIVFEELITNALVHRDYFIKDSIKVFIFDDHVEIRSPGRLPNSLTVDQMRRGVRRSRNVLLASFAPDLLRYKGVGSGVLRALKQWPHITWVNDVEGDELTAIIGRNVA